MLLIGVSVGGVLWFVFFGVLVVLLVKMMIDVWWFVFGVGVVLLCVISLVNVLLELFDGLLLLGLILSVCSLFNGGWVKLMVLVYLLLQMIILVFLWFDIFLICGLENLLLSKMMWVFIWVVLQLVMINQWWLCVKMVMLFLVWIFLVSRLLVIVCVVLLSLENVSVFFLLMMVVWLGVCLVLCDGSMLIFFYLWILVVSVVQFSGGFSLIVFDLMIFCR